MLCGGATVLVITNVMEIKDSASWAQAVGGFFAIVAAFMIGNSQTRASLAAVELSDRLSYARKCNALLAVAAELGKVSDKAFSVYESKNQLIMIVFEGEWTRPLDTLLDELKDIRAHEFGNQRVLSQVISLKVSSSYLKNMLEKMPDALREIDNDDNWNKFDHLLSVIQINRTLITRASNILNEELQTTIGNK